MPNSPVTDRLAACLREAGWESTRSWSGGLDYPTIPKDQVPQFDAALKDCSETSGWDAAQSLDPTQVRELYQQEVQAHDCYLSIGIDSESPPSEQVYLDTYQSADQYYAFLPGFDALTAGKMQEAVAKCPPPTWFVDVSGLG